MDIDGNVRYDSGTEGGSELENHLDRDEISDALKNGSGYALQRESRTLGGQWFYSATLFKDNGLIIRTAHIYDVSMGLMLASDRNYFSLRLPCRSAFCSSSTCICTNCSSTSAT